MKIHPEMMTMKLEQKMFIRKLDSITRKAVKISDRTYKIVVVY